MMILLSVLTGIITGWIGIDLLVRSLTSAGTPNLYQVGMAFVGGFTGYLLAVGG
tara:strand:+ start:142 stop:303 length:162 start_codon:yes stop_codon:yes gene_type:complete